MRALHPARTDSELYRHLLENAGDPGRRALDVLDIAIAALARDLPDPVVDGLHRAVARARKAVCGLEDPTLLQTVLSTESAQEVRQ